MSDVIILMMCNWTALFSFWYGILLPVAKNKHRTYLYFRGISTDKSLNCSVLVTCSWHCRHVMVCIISNSKFMDVGFSSICCVAAFPFSWSGSGLADGLLALIISSFNWSNTWLRNSWASWKELKTVQGLKDYLGPSCPVGQLICFPYVFCLLGQLGKL
jgi:hypothetical protein